MRNPIIEFLKGFEGWFDDAYKNWWIHLFIIGLILAFIWLFFFAK